MNSPKETKFKGIGVLNPGIEPGALCRTMGILLCMGIETFHHRQQHQQPYSAGLDPKLCMTMPESPPFTQRWPVLCWKCTHIHHPSPSPSLLFAVRRHSSAQVALLLACAGLKVFPESHDHPKSIKVVGAKTIHLRYLKIKLFLVSPLRTTIPTCSTKLDEVPWLRVSSCLMVFGSKSFTPVCMAMGVTKIFKTSHAEEVSTNGGSSSPSTMYTWETSLPLAPALKG